MKKSRYTDSQIIAVRKQAEAGAPVPNLCRGHVLQMAQQIRWDGRFADDTRPNWETPRAVKYSLGAANSKPNSNGM